MEDAGSLLREARRTAGLSQAQLARCLGISQAAVAKLERRGVNPTIRTLDKALHATGHELRLDVRRRASVDPSLIRRHLELTPAQRLTQLEAMYEWGRELALAGARAREVARERTGSMDDAEGH